MESAPSHIALFALSIVLACGSQAGSAPNEQSSAGAPPSDGGVVVASSAATGPGGQGAHPTHASETAGAAGSSAAGGAATTSAAGSPSPDAGGSAEPARSFKADCLAYATDECEACLCSDCTQPLEDCKNTPGCAEILSCTRESGCVEGACYCGDFDPLACLGGQSNGPCKTAVLDAPGGRVPSFIDPSGGPASDAAVAISKCAETGEPCAAACAKR